MSMPTITVGLLLSSLLLVTLPTDTWTTVPTGTTTIQHKALLGLVTAKAASAAHATTGLIEHGVGAINATHVACGTSHTTVRTGQLQQAAWPVTRTVVMQQVNSAERQPAALTSSIGKQLSKDDKVASSAAWVQFHQSGTVDHVSAADAGMSVQRFKRQPPAHHMASGQAMSAVQYTISLPAVSLPPLPPFPSNIALSPFAGSFATGTSSHTSKSTTHQNLACGGVLNARHGYIHTPNFPHKFETPIECVWIIDASELSYTSNGSANSRPSTGVANTTIIIYFTQLYVLGGLRFTEYMYYSDDYKVPSHRVFTLTEDDVTQVAVVQFNSQYLEIRFVMTSLDGTHLRALDRLLDVYGFNITYEVQHEAKPYQCNALQCRFLGHCYAKSDYSAYYCHCFSGFSGTDCGRGPLCEDPNTNICQNGGTCKHIGDAAITCHCPAGYKGTKCEIPEINKATMGCTANASLSDCHRECAFDAPGQKKALLGKTRNPARSGKTRYEVTIRLGANLTAYYRHTELERRPTDNLPSLLERHLMRVLRNFNITKISDLELISNSTDRLDITFHFFGIKGDSMRIREAITRMVERGRIGNITLVSNYHHFNENPPLNLLDMTVNQKSAVREDSEFIISCMAQGSARMQFEWFKDGSIVNASKATREIWTTVLPPETKDIFTAILGVTKASRMDEGIYTCKVTDWGVEQCRSLHVHIKSAPHLRVDPASVTLQRGDSLRVRCLSPGNDDIKRYAQLGYSWTRNGKLFQADPATVMWEDLYPDGSILKINNIQKSAEYSCLVSNTVKPVSKSVYITVIDRSMVHVCHAETSFGVRWPTSAPGAPIISDCPRGFKGHAKRICEQRGTDSSVWLTPDFSHCICDRLLDIFDNFQALAAGFQQTNSSAILKALFGYTIRQYKSFLPGEASFLIDMLNKVDAYLLLKGTRLEREMAAEIILHILDKVMQSPQSLNTQQQIKKLQLLTQSAALNRETIAASQLATSTQTAAAAAAPTFVATAGAGAAANADVDALSDASAANSPGKSTVLTSQKKSIFSAPDSAIAIHLGSNEQRGQLAAAPSPLLKSDTSSASILTVDENSLSLDRLKSLRIYMTSVKTLPFNLRIYGDDLFSDQLYMDIGLSARLLKIMANSTVFASVISYKNLKSFLPKTYYTRGSDPHATDYILASRIIQTWLFQSNRSNDNFRVPLELPFEIGHVEIVFQHETVSKDSNWIAICGHDYKASFESTWRSDRCITKNLMENITRCICPVSGTYVVMLTQRHSHPAQQSQPSQHPLFVIISCACCLLQSCSAFIILLPIWFNRKCAITFLKMQFCVSTSSMMLIFLLGFLKMLPMNWQALISSSLASLLLLGISTLIAIALVIHSELVPKKLHHMSNTTAEQCSTALTAAQKSTDISVTNITQISDSATNGESPNRTQRTKQPTAPAAGIRGAIGISWLLPLLFAIAAPLICSIIGKWPQHWWLQVMTTVPHPPTTTSMLDNDSTASIYGELNNYLPNMGAGNTTTPATTPASVMGPSDGVSDNHLLVTTTTMLNVLDNTDAPLRTLSSGFLIFLCIDLLFVLLFFALFVILIRKLMWLWRKSRSLHQHPLDKCSVAMRRRIGLLYRTKCLLLMKLATDALFIAYTNASSQDSWWSYPFGIACVFLGFAILLCFVIKTECHVRLPASNANSNGNANSSTSSNCASKPRLSTSKSNLDDKYVTSSINSPLDFYAAQDKEKESESGAPKRLSALQQTLEIPAGVQLPLTIISTAPHCQMLPPHHLSRGVPSLMEHPSRVGSFLGTASLDRKVVLPQLPTVATTATRCCNILGGSTGVPATMGDHLTATAHPVPVTSPTASTGMRYYDAYGGSFTVAMTGSLGRRPPQQQSLAPQEFIGVETLDILQGVAPETIIGIRSSNMLTPAAYHQQAHQQQQKHQQMVSQAAIVSMHGSASVGMHYAGISASPAVATTAIGPTTTPTTQTAKSQKRVTIMEPTMHTFDPLLPTMDVVSSSTLTATTATTTPPAPPPPQHSLTNSIAIPAPIITITSTSLDDDNPRTVGSSEANEQAAFAVASCESTPDEENSINGMFDRISHDLDYLLNRTNQMPPASAPTARLSDSSIDHGDSDLAPTPMPSATLIPSESGASRGLTIEHNIINKEV